MIINIKELESKNLNQINNIAGALILEHEANLVEEEINKFYIMLNTNKESFLKEADTLVAIFCKLSLSLSYIKSKTNDEIIHDKADILLSKLEKLYNLFYAYEEDKKKRTSNTLSSQITTGILYSPTTTGLRHLPRTYQDTGDADLIMKYGFAKLNYLIHMFINEVESDKSINYVKKVIIIKNQINRHRRDISTYGLNVVIQERIENNIRELLDLISINSLDNKYDTYINNIISSMEDIMNRKNMNSQEIIGKAWLYKNISKFNKLLCNNKRIVDYMSDKEKQRKVEIISVIADVIMGSINLVPAIVASAMIINYGLENICMSDSIYIE